jgi:hypothetical protein
MISFLIIPLNKSRISDSLMSHATSIRVLLSPAGLNMMTRVPITDTSVRDTSTNFLEYCPTAWTTFRSLKPTVTSLSVVLPSFLALLTVRFCQYRGSSSTSEMMFHTVPMDAEISLAFISYTACTPPKAALPPHPSAKPVSFAYAVPSCTLVSTPAPVHGFINVTRWPGF